VVAHPRHEPQHEFSYPEPRGLFYPQVPVLLAVARTVKRVKDLFLVVEKRHGPAVFFRQPHYVVEAAVARLLPGMIPAPDPERLAGADVRRIGVL
jgi:hypothetical protein